MYQEHPSIFKLEGIYNKNIKNMFDSLAKFSASSN